MTSPLRLLVFDSAYTYRMLKERELESLVTGRDLEGYFGNVLTVNAAAAFADKVEGNERFGTATLRHLSERHWHLEGKAGRFRALARLPRFNFLLAQLSLLRAILGHFGGRKPVLVRSEDALFNGFLAWACSRLLRRPLVIGIWGNPDKARAQAEGPIMPRVFFSSRAERSFERFILRRADLVGTQSEDECEYVCSIGVDKSRVRIFPMSTSLEKVHWRPPAERADGIRLLGELGVAGGPTLLCVARLEKVKLIDEMIRLVAVLERRGVQVTLVIAGEGEAEAQLRSLCVELVVEARVVFAGNRSQSWLAEVYPVVSALVAPYTGRALAEAALGGAAVVAYDVEWHRELIISGETGDVVPFRDIEAMATAIERLLDLPDRTHTLRAALRSLALEKFDTSSARMIYIAAYQGLIDPGQEVKSDGFVPAETATGPIDTVKVKDNFS